jgi:hypothetical protein
MNIQEGTERFLTLDLSDNTNRYNLTVSATTNSPLSNRVTNPEDYIEQSTKTLNSISWSINTFTGGIGDGTPVTYYTTTHGTQVVEIGFTATFSEDVLDKILSTFSFSSPISTNDNSSLKTNTTNISNATTNSNSDTTADWKAYINSEYGFSLKLPPNLNLKTYYSGKQEYFGVELNRNGITIDPTGVVGFGKVTVINKTNILLGGKAATKSIIQANSTSKYPLVTFTDYRQNGWTAGNYIYVVPTTSEDAALLDTILSTFKFTK